MATKKKAASANVDDLLDGNGASAEAPAEKPAKAKKAAAPAAKKAAAKKPAAKKSAGKGKAKTDDAEKAPAESALRKALLKVRKAVSYADFAEANDFPIRSVRRTARAMRDAGEIQLSKEGTAVFISAAV